VAVSLQTIGSAGDSERHPHVKRAHPLAARLRKAFGLLSRGFASALPVACARILATDVARPFHFLRHVDAPEFGDGRRIVDEEREARMPIKIGFNSRDTGGGGASGADSSR
jgi:hypothetical protein